MLLLLTALLSYVLAVSTETAAVRPQNITELDYRVYALTGSYYNGTMTFRWSPKDWGEPVNIPICKKYQGKTIEQSFDALTGIIMPGPKPLLGSPINIAAEAWKKGKGIFDHGYAAFNNEPIGTKIWNYSIESHTSSSYSFRGSLSDPKAVRQYLNLNTSSCTSDDIVVFDDGWLLQDKDRGKHEYKNVDIIDPVFRGTFDSKSANFEIQGTFYVNSYHLADGKGYNKGGTRWTGPLSIVFNGTLDNARSDELVLGREEPEWKATLGYTKAVNGSEIHAPKPGMAVSSVPSGYMLLLGVLVLFLGVFS